MSTTQGTCIRTPSGVPKTQDGTVTCNLGDLTGGSSATITIVVTATKPGTLTGAATVTASNVSGDADDTKTVSTNVTGA